MWLLAGRRSARPVWAIVAVLFGLLAPVAQVSHGALSAHRYCEEHQRVEDEAAASTNDRDEAPAPEDSDAESHDECWLLALRGAGSTVAPDGGLLVPPPGAPRGRLGLTRGPPPLATELLSLAPKTSPPLG